MSLTPIHLVQSEEVDSTGALVAKAKTRRKRGIITQVVSSNVSTPPDQFLLSKSVVERRNGNTASKVSLLVISSIYSYISALQTLL